MNNITFFSTSPDIGGCEKVLINVANEFAQKNFEVEFIFCTLNGVLINELHPDIKIFSLNSKVRWALFRFYKIVLKRKPAIIISGPQSVNFLSIFVSLFPFTRYKTVVTHHNFHNLEIKKSFLGSLNPLFLKILYNLSDTIVAVSNELKMHLINDFKIDESKIKVITNPVVNSRMVLQSMEDVNEFPFKENIPILISLGRLSVIKNYTLMLEAFSFLLKKMSAYLVIIGEGEERESISKMITNFNIRDSVVLLGAKSNPYKYIAKSDLLIHTSISESFGMALAESLALGIPVIASDTNGANEVTDHGKYGTIFHEKKPEELASLIYTVIHSEHDTELLKQRGFLYSAENSLKGYLNVIGELQK